MLWCPSSVALIVVLGVLEPLGTATRLGDCQIDVCRFLAYSLNKPHAPGCPDSFRGYTRTVLDSG